MQDQPTTDPDRSTMDPDRSTTDADGQRTDSGDSAVHARRSALYGYVATALEFPGDDALADLRADPVQDAVETAATELATAVDAGRGGDEAPGRALPERVRDLSAAVDAATDDEVETAYNHLFGLPGDDGTYPVVPYEAHYATTGDVNETQRRVATIVGLLERFDLEPHDEFDERQDHVAALLELAQVLAAQRAVALDGGEADAADTLAAAEATVLDEHLLGFVPALAHDVDDAIPGSERSNGERVYAAAARLAAALVEWDATAHPEPAAATAGGSGGDRR
ncbi:molecular chaperone TorD family protein [Halorubellus sp. PRR65]|uniref:TorD/DmsD family molecular chaperone n=1 Tax=Halorubellus sp. PRR65 TaxID=3098148 RepID=UPI002B25E695|nr:molecular chaperone TorD family protein [Halorubellus sp. PRR65]